MSLEAVQAEPKLAGRVLAFSGRYATPPDHAPEDATLHLLHGLLDEVIPARPAMADAQRLVQLGADVTGDALPGIGHELHPQLIDKAVHHLRSFLPQKAWKEAMVAAAELDRLPKGDLAS
jgi:phospholipase/carboxylesterase